MVKRSLWKKSSNPEPAHTRGNEGRKRKLQKVDVEYCATSRMTLRSSKRLRRRNQSKDDHDLQSLRAFKRLRCTTESKEQYELVNKQSKRRTLRGKRSSSLAHFPSNSRILMNHPGTNKNHSDKRKELLLSMVRKDHRIVGPNIVNRHVDLGIQESDTVLLKGLKNLNNTCYFNSIIQCLLHCPIFKEAIETAPTEALTVDVVKHLLILFGVMNASGSLPYVTPIECLTAVLNTSQCQEAGMRLNGIQHDSSEFLILLLQHFFKKYRPLSDIFEGVMLSTQTCQQCSHYFTTHQPFKLYTLQMDLPLNNTQIYDLYTLMEYFHRGEIVSGYSCAQCDAQNSIEKQLSIISTPTILVVHIARFKGLQKIDYFVRFPATLTISYRVDDNEYETKYRITGMVIHKGNSIAQGHYFAYIRRGETWVKADDETVREVRWETARRKKAYLLFYEQM